MTLDMTQGNAKSHILHFAIPILLGNLFQLTYNAVDSIIIAKAAGTAALAAVGAANPVMNIIILGVSGLTIGASVLMSKAFGAKHEEEIKKAFSTLLILGLFFSAIVILFAFIGSRGLLKALKVPDEILPSSTHYLMIILLGMPFTYTYNAYAAAMRAVGDAKTPVRYLALSSCLNALLDAIFIIPFGMGVIGAGLATVIAQAISALLCFVHTQRNIPLICLRFSDMKLDRKIMHETLSYGSVTALQQSCQPIGKLLIQCSINSLGIGSIAVFNAVSRVEDFALTPEQSISHAMMTYTGQNRGAENKKRIKEGLISGLFLECCYYVCILMVILVFSRAFMHLFLNEQDLIALGVQYLSLMAFFYVESGFTNGIQGYFRGMGKMTYTLIGTLIQISVRVIITFALVPRIGLIGVALATACGWACMLLFLIPMAIHTQKQYQGKKI